MQHRKTVYTLKNHAEHLETLIKEMESSSVTASSDKDEENASNQLQFLKNMLAHINEMLSLSGLSVSAKKSLGEKMTALPKKYFGDEEVPNVDGDKSRAYAIQVAKHYRSFTRVQFNSFEVEASRWASSLSFLNIRSIPDQIAHHSELVEKTEKNVNRFDKPGFAFD